MTALAVVAAAGTAACERRASRPSGGGADQNPSPAPSAATPAGPLEPVAGGSVTPRTQAPNEARVLSAAFSAVARALRPSVVRIDVEIGGGGGRVAEDEGEGDNQPLAPFLKRFFHFGQSEPMPGPQRGTGSGVVMDVRGDVLTNRHVVANATTLKVTFSDGREFPAKTVGTDAETDVAVIRLDKPPKDLVAARLGDSDKLEVGEWVLAVGSPLGLDQTVTAGIVSGKGKVGRHVQMSGGRVRQYIQTDAKINPGNSGGPLVNLSSEVVGVNTLINTGPGGAYGFAIPINQVRVVAGSLLKEGRVRYPYLGVLVSDAGAGEEGGAPRPPGAATGAVVSQVTPGGPAGKAGVRPGDVITDLDGHKIETAGDVIEYVSSREIGARVAVGISRQGQRQVIPVVLAELPGQPGEQGGQAGFGMALQTLTPGLAQSMGLDPSTRGAVVAEVASDGPAAAAGVRVGDILLEVDRQRVSTAEEASTALAAARKGGHLVRLRGPEGIRFITLGGS